MRELVSVIVPTYKRPAMLVRALESLVQQTYKNIEVIVVDDNGVGSPYDEEVEDVIQSYMTKFTNFKFVKNTVNIGGGLSRNEGIKLAQGEFVTFLDDDDEYYPDKIRKQLLFFKESSLDNLGYVYCQIDFFNDKGEKIKKSRNYYRGNRLPYLQHFKACISGTPTIFIKNSVLKEIGGFKDLKSGQDWTLVAEILRAGYSVDYLEEALVAVHNHNDTRISTSVAKFESMQKDILQLKQAYIYDECDEVKNYVYAYHYYQLASALKYRDRRLAWRYFDIARSYHLPIKKKIKFIISWFLGFRVMRYLGR